mmetsp:Transcript_64102/g.150448  ORF Transcript_64102/g.150448 Transcript_64102/m.150448 type:complete len:281 (-) Transcript_64102:1546-2388(-)
MCVATREEKHKDRKKHIDQDVSVAAQVKGHRCKPAPALPFLKLRVAPNQKHKHAQKKEDHGDRLGEKGDDESGRERIFVKLLPHGPLESVAFKTSKEVVHFGQQPTIFGPEVQTNHDLSCHEVSCPHVKTNVDDYAHQIDDHVASFSVLLVFKAKAVRHLASHLGHQQIAGANDEREGNGVDHARLLTSVIIEVQNRPCVRRIENAKVKQHSQEDEQQAPCQPLHLSGEAKAVHVVPIHTMRFVMGNRHCKALTPEGKSISQRGHGLVSVNFGQKDGKGL